MNRKIATVITAAAATAGLALATAGPAAAATPHAALPDPCLTGAYAGYCGHQTDTRGLTLTVGAGLKVTNQLFLTPNTQMVWENNGLPDNEKIALWFAMLPAQYAMTQVGTFAVMQPYVPGDAAQEWSAVPVPGGFAWVNVGSGDVISGHGFMQVPVSLVSGSLATADPYTFIEG